MSPPGPRVLLLCKGLGLGGAERLGCAQVAGRAVGPGAVRYEVAYVRPDKDALVGELRAAGAPVHHLAAARGGWPRALAALLREVRPDVVHSHSPLVAAAARALVALGCAGRGARHVYTEHNRWDAYRASTRRVNQATMALDARVWAVSEDARRSVRPAALRRRVQTLTHGIDTRLVATHRLDPEQRADARRRLGLPIDAVVATNIANLRPEKDHAGLLAAFDRAADRVPALHLVAVGVGVDTDPGVVGAAGRSPHADRLHLLGFRPDALDVLAASDLLVLGSRHEGLPVAVMEAVALGIPVVATAVGGIPELLGRSEAALLVPPRDPQQLAGALEALATDPSRRARAGRAAAALAGEVDAARAVAEVEAAYREVAGRG